MTEGNKNRASFFFFFLFFALAHLLPGDRPTTALTRGTSRPSRRDYPQQPLFDMRGCGGGGPGSRKMVILRIDVRQKAR